MNIPQGLPAGLVALLNSAAEARKHQDPQKSFDLLTQARRLERLAAERLKDFPKDDAESSDD